MGSTVCCASSGAVWMRTACRGLLPAVVLGLSALAEGFQVFSDKPNTVTFEPREARFVRFVCLAANSASQVCLDELEVFGPDSEDNLALATNGATASASSCLSGHTIHQIEHLNDGNYGNSFSWIAAGTDDEWAQIELPAPCVVNRVVFSRDRLGQYRDRTPVSFSLWVSLDGVNWERVARVMDAVNREQGPKDIPNPPKPPEVEGARPFPTASMADAAADPAERLRYAFLGEEHAWLKTYGRADISPALVPYNGRVQEYPRHVGDDLLPLPPIESLPTFDGRLDDACWQEASRGVVRVAWPYDLEKPPLIEYEVFAGHHDGDLFLAIRTDRLLSRHIAVLSSGDWAGCGIVMPLGDHLVLRSYSPDHDSDRIRIEGAFDQRLECFEMRLPLSLFPGCEKEGLRVGLGIGAKHTDKTGRPVNFVFAPLAIAEVPPCLSHTFRLRLRLAKDAPPTILEGDVEPLREGLKLEPGESKVISIPAQRGPIGPECNLILKENDERSYALHLFRYDPIERALTQGEELAKRLTEKGIDTRAEQQAFSELRKRQEQLLALAIPGPKAERAAFLEARMAKRRLLFRDPDLAPIEKILFVKRFAFRPSHNYSVLLDAPYRPGGAVCLLEIPREDGRYEPADARLIEIFEAGGGIARNPMADFDLSRIYFGYRPSKDGYFHVMVMNPDGSEVRQLTDGPFHDYWPCPLPDGGIAFISTRCKARYLCWRPQAAVMFRMDPDGGNIRPLSFANLTEWAPSVMEDGRILWTRSEYVDKGADFGHTLWAIRPDGRNPELVFGNTIIQPNGYANGRQVPGTNEICCTLISHFGDLNGPITLIDINEGRFNQKAIHSITPEVPWPGAPPMEECFRDPVPISRDYVLCSHAPRDRFGLWVIDRYGNRELLFSDPAISSMCPTPYRRCPTPPALADDAPADTELGELVLADVYRGIAPPVKRGDVKYIRVVEEVRSNLEQLANGAYRHDHEPFMHFYASPVDLVNGPSGWPTYVAKAPHGIVPVEEDGSARFYAPAGKVLYFQALDKDFNELQRMRSVVQLQPGERRSCIGCHEHRQMAPPNTHRLKARTAQHLDCPPWSGAAFSFEEVVQPVLDTHCVTCHDEDHKMHLDFTGTLDENRVPASYRSLIIPGLVNYCDYGWNSGGCEKKEPLTFGTLKSKLWDVLNAGHHGVRLTTDDVRRLKTWIDLNCPLWPDYVERTLRPRSATAIASAR